jgi:hypothetical protein
VAEAALLVALLTLAGLAVLAVRLVHGLLLSERAHVAELLRLLEARAAPTEYATYVHSPDPAPQESWLFSPDGLVGVREDD